MCHLAKGIVNWCEFCKYGNRRGVRDHQLTSGYRNSSLEDHYLGLTKVFCLDASKAMATLSSDFYRSANLLNEQNQASHQDHWLDNSLAYWTHYYSERNGDRTISPNHLNSLLRSHHNGTRWLPLEHPAIHPVSFLWILSTQWRNPLRELCHPLWWTARLKDCHCCSQSGVKTMTARISLIAMQLSLKDLSRTLQAMWKTEGEWLSLFLIECHLRDIIIALVFSFVILPLWDDFASLSSLLQKVFCIWLLSCASWRQTMQRLTTVIENIALRFKGI